MNIQKRSDHLPTKIEDLNKWILIGKVKLKSQIAAIKAIKDINESIAAKEAALSDTQDLAEELLYAEARLGEMLAKGSPKGTFKKGGEKSLPDGINKKQSHISKSLYKNPDKIAEVVSEAREKGEVPVRQHVLNRIRSPHSMVGVMTGNEENYTPKEIIEKVRYVLGVIDLDPASCEYAQRVVKAKRYYTEKDNGLSKTWKGNVFLNPPYGMPKIRQFTDKLINELSNMSSAILLTNDQTDTLWWQKCASEANLICLHKGRISFDTPNGTRTSPTNGQTLFYYGNEKELFYCAFSTIGLIVRRLRDDDAL